MKTMYNTNLNTEIKEASQGGEGSDEAHAHITDQHPDWSSSHMSNCL